MAPALTCAADPTGGVPETTATRRPDIVLMIVDDMSWTDTSLHGAPDIRSPNMERIAAAGMTFNRAFVASPTSAPSRGALLTAMNPVRNGALFNHQSPRPGVKRWPAYFKELGYEVVAIGKVAHYAQVTGYGFDYVSHYKYHQDDCVEHAINWLAARKSDKPLCLIVGTNWPHVPWPDVSAATLDPAKVALPPMLLDTPEMRVAWARYAAAVANADRDAGLVYDAARKHLGEGVFFAFTSDNGAQFPFHKWTCYDGGLRTPLVTVWPGRVAAGSRADAMVGWIDLMPTLLEVAGGSPPRTGLGAGEIDGASFLATLRDARTPHRDAVFATHSGDGRMNEYPMRAVRTERWKYIRNLSPENEFHTHIDRVVKDEGYWPSWIGKARADADAQQVVARYFKRPAEELYDIETDPHELRNLAGDPACAQTMRDMRRKLDDWMASQGDQGLETERKMKPVAKK